MIYLVCPTCGTLFDDAIEFEYNKKNIYNDPNLSIDQKNEKLSNLLLSLGLENYCCKMRYLTYKDIVEILQPLNN